MTRVQVGGVSMTPTQSVLSQIRDERAAQDGRWGEQNHPDGTVHYGVRHATEAARHYRTQVDAKARSGHLTWTDILLEEVYEALAESDPAALRAELIQVAAVATAWAEAIDRRAVRESG